MVRIPPFFCPVGAAAVVVAAATEVAGTACSVGREVVGAAVGLGATVVVGAAAEVVVGAAGLVVGAVVVEPPPQDANMRDSTTRALIATQRILLFILFPPFFIFIRDEILTKKSGHPKFHSNRVQMMPY